MSLPSEREINPEGNSYDGQEAVRQVLGKTRERLVKELATRLHWSFYESFYYMGSKAFCFYFPAVTDYLTTPEARTDDGLVENFCDVLEGSLQSRAGELREGFPDIIRFVDYVLAHFGEFGYSPEQDQALQERLRAIRLQCAEPPSRSQG